MFSAAGFDVFTVAATREPIVSQGFVRVTPEHAIADAPKIDILVIPGGHAASLYDDPKMMARLKTRVAAAELTMSVCTGALVLARAGLLDGLRATTHNGRIVTTQGVSAGIDGALHVVERLLGSERAWTVARYMMYRWEPSLPASAKDELRPYIEQDWPKVLAVYQRKLAAHPKDGDAAFRVGVAQYELEDHAHAVVTLERAIALGVDEPDAYDELGDSYAALGRFGDAARAYEREVPLRPSQVQPIIVAKAKEARKRAAATASP